MRAAVGCVALALFSFVAGDARGALPQKGEPSCEDQCRLDSERGDNTCDEQGFAASVRDSCHEIVKARFAVCLRICED